MQKSYLLERAGIENGTAVLFAVPYFTPDCLRPDRNLSAYAVAKDYHGYFADLFRELIPLLQQRFPSNRFAGFADHSPIAEVEAAAKAGLGVIGENRLLITEDYSSYVFLGSLITDALLPTKTTAAESCIGCGACKKACPAANGSECLSALTQKKGVLSPIEEEQIVKHGSAWGCDLCQACCPYTRRALEKGSIFTAIPYFLQDNLPHLTVRTLSQMSDDAFSSRAYSWRGKATVLRNLQLLEKDQKPC